MIFDLAMHKSRQRIIAVLCLTVAAIGIVFFRVQLAPGSADTNLLARIDHPLPALTVENQEGTVDLRTFISSTRSVIVFYSPSCKTCQKVLHALQPFPDTLRLILVNESPDEGDLKLSEIQGAVQFHDRWKILSRSFAGAALPTILFVDEAGILRDGIVGFYRHGFVQGKLKNFADHSYIGAR